MDWLASNLPREGQADLAGDHLVNVPTCQLDERAGAVLERHSGEDGDVVFTDGGGVVAGTVAVEDLRRRPDQPVEGLVRPGITTVRASEDTEELARRMDHAGVKQVLVTTPQGVLLGAFRPPSGG